MKISNMLSVVMAWAAHLLAWAASIWLAFGPIYQGVSYSGVEGSSEPSSSTLNPEDWTHYTETLIEANGLQVVLVLIIPILMTGIIVLTVHRADIGTVWRIVLIWGLALALFGLCYITLLSIGTLYLPATLALFITAVIDSIAKVTARR
ncbi:MAG: hypothetical protein OXC83_03425 [Chloroflexi bacterium]|nr:hypothetical protein [Chloroflexota bacterium]